MNKYFLLGILLLILNSLDIVYLVAFKFDLPVPELYIVLVTLIIFIIFIIFKRYSYNNLIYFLIGIFYFLFQLLNGIFHTSSFSYPIVVFISFSFTIYLVQIFYKCEKKELYFFIKLIFFTSIILYFFIDVFSIFVLFKSQHVLLSNNLPFLLLTGLTIYITEISSKEKLKVFLFLFLYISWIFISAYLYTTDFRIQMKAIGLSLSLLIGFMLFVLVKGFIPITKKFTPFIILIAIIFIFIGFYFIVDYLLLNSLEGRETSLGLRIAVGVLMIQEVMNGTLTDLIFGYGLGSSMQDFYIPFGTTFFYLKSHSGLLSLFYEHGLISIILIFIPIIMFTFNFNRKNKSLEKDFYNNSFLLLLILLIASWFVLNILYIIAINVPNYGHQSQLISVILLAIYLNKIIYKN